MTRLRWLLCLTLLALLTASIGQRTGALAAGSRIFPETGKTVSGKFLDYWTAHGGLAQQGYPISNQMSEVSDTDGKIYTVQYFERAVFELHPENAGKPSEVLLTLLGSLLYNEKYPDGAEDQSVNTGNPRRFSETGKTIGGVFRTYWEQHGGLAQQGYPISNEFMETSDTDGQTYKVQYFERAVFEYHPENAGTPSQVLLSLLGTFRYGSKYGGTTEPTATPTFGVGIHSTATPTATEAATEAATETATATEAATSTPTPDRSSLTKAGWTTITATTNNIVLFYNKNTGESATARIGSDGALTPLLQSPNTLSAGYTTIIPCPNNNLMLYSSTSGAYRIASVADDGTISVNIAFTIAQGWSIISADFDTGNVVYYNPTTKLLAVDSIAANGQAVSVSGITYASPTVSRIVPVGANSGDWIFYSREGSDAYTMHLNSNGTFQQMGSKYNFGPYWDFIVTDWAGHQLWYDRTNAAIIITGLNSAREPQPTVGYSSVNTQWTDLVSTPNRFFLFYDPAGNIAIDQILTGDTEQRVQTYTAGQ